MIECRSCNAQNPNGSISCTVCGGELPMSNPVAVLNKPKMAVFHVEETILDNAAGERIAKRKGLSGKRFEREVASNVEKAVSRAGVRDYVNKLSRDGYTIAFLSGLEAEYQFRLQDRLRHLGYPVMADTSGPLVLAGNIQNNIRSLNNRYDIIFYYGTTGAGTAKQAGAPGVYATVNDYIGDTNNPYIAPESTPAPYSLSGLRPEPIPAPYTLANPVTLGPMRNPVPKPRSQTSKKSGKKRRESAKKYFDRLMGSKMMNKEFPDNSQRSAVALRYVKEEYGQRGVDSVTKTWSPMDNPDFTDPRTGVTATGISEEAVEMALMFALQQSGTDPNVARNESRQVIETLPPKATLQGNRQQSSLYADDVLIQGNRNHVNGYAMKSVTIQGNRNTGEITVPIGAKVVEMGNRNSINIRRVSIETFATEIYTILTGKQTLSPMTNPTTEGLPIYSGQPTGAKNLGMVTAVVQVGRGFMKDIGEGLQDFYRALTGGRQSMTEKRLMMAVAEMHRDLTKGVEQKGGNAIGNIRLDYEYPMGSGRSMDITLIATADALKVPKKNPASPKKLKKAKDAYKKFHGGKTPDEITTAKVDVGDVWYSLGECWTIGYKSPKENGNEHQKFIHEMNEESKDGNYPILYATMPENGEPMLIIKGGSMKIGMRDGKAWLID
jgi:uncharacterized protein YbjQ (UPF0145 family)